MRMDEFLQPNKGTYSKNVDDVIVFGKGRAECVRNTAAMLGVLPGQLGQAGALQVPLGQSPGEVRGVHRGRPWGGAGSSEVGRHQELAQARE